MTKCLSTPCPREGGVITPKGLVLRTSASLTCALETLQQTRLSDSYIASGAANGDVLQYKLILDE